MIKEFSKGSEVRVGNHFVPMDFDCLCRYPNCNYTLIDTDLVSALDELSSLFGLIKINSGFRCSQHNKDVRGMPGSYHMIGLASDISSQYVGVGELLKAAERIPVFENGGIGLYSNFIHLDARGYKARWGG